MKDIPVMMIEAVEGEVSYFSFIAICEDKQDKVMEAIQSEARSVEWDWIEHRLTGETKGTNRPESYDESLIVGMIDPESKVLSVYIGDDGDVVRLFFTGPGTELL